MNQLKIASKAIIVGVLTLVLLIPLLMIEGVVSERKATRESVINDIARSATGAQRVAGPVLVVPYRERFREISTHEKTGKEVVRVWYEEKIATFLPSDLKITNEVATAERHRGIHKARLYTSAMSMKGSFRIPEAFGLLQRQANIEWRPAQLVVGVLDVRGIRKLPRFLWQGVERPFEPGATQGVFESGIHADLGRLSSSAEATYDFAFDLSLQGMERLEFLPLGGETVITARSSWPHPSFFGRYLPDTRTVTEKGFDATWQTTHFATNMEQIFQKCGQTECPALRENSLGVWFIDPVDVYLQTERAVKYGALFIGITFAAFFFFELFKELPIHPIQYGLVGGALAVFYLLLVSLSEHLSFAPSYLAATVGCVGLITFYLRYVLKSVVRSIGFGALLSSLYGVLFVLLRSEDYALLMGSIVLFTLLAFVMILTRKVDWYRLGERDGVVPPPKPDPLPAAR